MHLPESFEWLILASGLIDGNRIRDILNNPSDYILSEQYFSWEQFFTALLIQETTGTYLHYQKSNLNPAYLHPKAVAHIIGIMPEAVQELLSKDR